MNKQLRITALLVLDTAFALLELISGYAVHSLALIADSFHMFNDILSLIVALWAVKVAKKGRDGTYTYGLERAEILGALINAVFLLALCVTIILEAVQRFIEVPVVTNPQLILAVGFAGLLSNILGLFLFHEHGHSHGGEQGGGSSHVHSHGSGHGGHSHSHSQDAEGRVEGSTGGHTHSHGPWSQLHGEGGDDEDNDFTSLLPESAIAREEARLLEYGATSERGHSSSDAATTPNHNAEADHQMLERVHGSHNHARKRNDTRNHRNKSMNMEGVFLHVLGDALGNIGVILSALFIWKTDFSWKYYADPFVSLVITAIIFASAVPLCLRASRVLLQAAPSTVNADEIRQDLESIPGVQDIHDLHIWQLSENQTVATLHVTIERSPSEFGRLSKTIQECFAGHGVPSITIQPEFQERRASIPGLRQCQSNGNLLH